VRVMMLGLNHEQAELDLRERVALDSAHISALYSALGQLRGYEGAVILSTCNRTEIYTTDALSMVDVRRCWSEQVGVPVREFADALYLRVGDDAIAHLFQVAAGLDAMVLGETEILGQVKAAYATAQQCQAVGSLHRTFQAAIKAAKRAHTETAISERALSLGYAALELARQVFGEGLPGRRVLVVGAGEMGANVLRHMAGAGAQQLVIVNRTPARAEPLAREVGARLAPWNDLSREVAASDVVITATKSPAPVVLSRWVSEEVRARRGDPWLFLDLSVPRNVPVDVGHLPGVLRYDVDDLKAVVQRNRARRAQEVEAVRRILSEEQAALGRDADAAEVAPVIRSLRQKAERIRQAELEELWRRHPDLSESERRAVERATHLMMTKLLNDPMVSIRTWASLPDGTVYVNTLRELFRLDDESLASASD